MWTTPSAAAWRSTRPLSRGQLARSGAPVGAGWSSTGSAAGSRGSARRAAPMGGAGGPRGCWGARGGLGEIGHRSQPSSAYAVQERGDFGGHGGAGKRSASSVDDRVRRSRRAVAQAARRGPAVPRRTTTRSGITSRSASRTRSWRSISAGARAGRQAAGRRQSSPPPAAVRGCRRGPRRRAGTHSTSHLKVSAATRPLLVLAGAGPAPATRASASALSRPPWSTRCGSSASPAALDPGVVAFEGVDAPCASDRERSSSVSEAATASSGGRSRQKLT